jgi:hypothetical protein
MFVLFTSPLHAGSEPIEIKLKKDAAGMVILVERSDSDKGEMQLTDATGKVLNGQKTNTQGSVAYQATILEKPADTTQPTRTRRQYEKAQITRDGKTEDLAYHKKTILIEKKDDKYHFQIEGGKELTGKDAEELDKEFNRARELDMDQIMLPAKPVRVGDSWKLDLKLFSEAFKRKGYPIELDLEKSTGTGKLVKTYQRDGRLFGVMEHRLDLRIKEMRMGDMAVPLNDSKIAMTSTVDACIDGGLQTGKSKLIFELKLQGELTAPDGRTAALRASFTGLEDKSLKELPAR